MKASSKLTIVLGIAAAFAVSLAVGVPFATLLLVGAMLLLCPAMMFFGMGMMMQHVGHGCGHCGEHAHNQSGEGATAQSEARRAA